MVWIFEARKQGQPQRQPARAQAPALQMAFEHYDSRCRDVVMNMLAILFITMEIADGFSVSITLWPATTEADFFLMVACVAFLWRPNPNASEYAYVKVLNSDESVYQLELIEESPTVLQDEQGNEDAIAAREFT